jgi:hypothetical protein
LFDRVGGCGWLFFFGDVVVVLVLLMSEVTKICFVVLRMPFSFLGRFGGVVSWYVLSSLVLADAKYGSYFVSLFSCYWKGYAALLDEACGRNMQLS